MSLFGDNCSTLEGMIKRYPDCEKAIIDTFHDMISNQSWEIESRIDMLESGLGISTTADVILQTFINIEKRYL